MVLLGEPKKPIAGPPANQSNGAGVQYTAVAAIQIATGARHGMNRLHGDYRQGGDAFAVVPFNQTRQPVLMANARGYLDVRDLPSIRNTQQIISPHQRRCADDACRNAANLDHRR